MRDLGTLGAAEAWMCCCLRHSDLKIKQLMLVKVRTDSVRSSSVTYRSYRRDFDDTRAWGTRAFREGVLEIAQASRRIKDQRLFQNSTNLKLVVE